MWSILVEIFFNLHVLCYKFPDNFHTEFPHSLEINSNSWKNPVEFEEYTNLNMIISNLDNLIYS